MLNPAMLTTLFSLVPSSTLKVIGGNTLLVGLIGDIAVLVIALVVKQERKKLEKWLGVIFSILLVAGVWLENIADEPRSLDAAAQHRISEQLKKFAGMPFDFGVQIDTEPVNLLEDVAAALNQAGWIWRPYEAATFFHRGNEPRVGMIVFSGLQIQIADSKTPDWAPAIEALRNSLNAEGIAASALRLTDKSENPNAIHIMIGKKP